MDLVGRRQKFIERQRCLHADTVDVDRSGREPQGTGPPNRHSRPQVPVGQRAVSNWPVLDLGDLPDIDLADWRLQVTGLVANPVELDWDAFLELPQVEDTSDFHCVTTWSRLDNRWKGVRFRDLAELVVAHDEAAYVLTTAYDHMPGTDVPYTTNLPLQRALDPDVLLVHTWEDQPLPREHGGPCRMITPRLYAWKGAKWIRRIELAAQDRPGFWEVRGYSNSAEPWLNDRYSS